MGKARFDFPQEDVAYLSALLIRFYTARVIAGGHYAVNEKLIRSRMDSIAKWLTSSSCKPGLMICGQIGTGKTEAAKAIETTLAYYRSKKGDPIRYPKANMVSAPDFAGWYADEGHEAADVYVKCRFAILDDLGTDSSIVKNYGNALTPVANLINVRSANGSRTVFTTNLAMNDIASVYGERTADRLRGMSEIMVFKGKSYRV